MGACMQVLVLSMDEESESNWDPATRVGGRTRFTGLADTIGVSHRVGGAQTCFRSARVILAW
jgi:hypothetical protein